MPSGHASFHTYTHSLTHTHLYTHNPVLGVSPLSLRLWWGVLWWGDNPVEQGESPQPAVPFPEVNGKIVKWICRSLYAECRFGRTPRLPHHCFPKLIILFLRHVPMLFGTLSSLGLINKSSWKENFGNVKFFRCIWFFSLKMVRKASLLPTQLVLMAPVASSKIL